MPAAAGKTDDFALVVREELRARKWTRRSFAQRLNTRESTVGRWLARNPASRKAPLPATVLRISTLLELNPLELLRLTGHLPMAKSQGPEHPHRQEIRARKRRLRRILESVDLTRFSDALVWADIALDGLQTMANRLEPAGGPDQAVAPVTQVS